jgi:hypothetical protein
MKIIALIPVWHRFELLKLCLLSLSEIKEIEPIFIISPGENENVIDLSKQYRHIWHENLPMGAKLNHGISQIMHLEFDYLMNFGSDNLINPELIEIYMKIKDEFMGIDNFYMVDINSKKTAIFRFNDMSYSPGAGRLIHKSILIQLFKKQKLYINKFNSGLDSCSADNIFCSLGIKQTIIKTNDEAYIIDIKTDQNINSFDSLCKIYDRIEYFEFDSIINKFGKAGKQLKLLYYD